MSILTFKGGVHPYDGKELSKDVAVRKVNPGKEVVIPGISAYRSTGSTCY